MPRERKSYCVYIMGSLSGTLYIGVTSNLLKRVFQHKFHRMEGFTDKYYVERLLYCESFDEVQKAIAREKQLKGWRRSKKIALIEFFNPHWLDLARDWYPWMTSSDGSRGPSTPPTPQFPSSKESNAPASSQQRCHPERSRNFTK
ncbi:MAG: GIY-YIG nuclease family protein [Acidobacteriia bacterium]|nr:GIY-YIG nuclease family protein [Terriglobia bacterium]